MRLLQDPQFLQDGEQVTQQPTSQTMPGDEPAAAAAETPPAASLAQGLSTLSVTDETAEPKDKAA
jgi:hypothetical protein